MKYLRLLFMIPILVSTNDAMQQPSGLVADIINQGKSKIELRKGTHLLDTNLPLKLARSLSVIGQERTYKIEHEKYQLGPEQEVKLKGSWILQDTASRSSKGLFDNLYLFNERPISDPATGVFVFMIIGGAWNFTKCCIMGTGTGHEGPALMIIGGELDDRGPPDALMCQSPVVRMYHTIVKELPAHEREVSSLALLPAFSDTNVVQ
eukprot:763326-Hanusia_phi.AAC.2